MDPFNKSGVDRGKESEQLKVGLDVTAVINYKNTFAVNRKRVTFSLALGEGVPCNTIFSWPFLNTIKSSIINNNNALVSGILGEQFSLEIMFPQRDKE